MMTGGCYLPMMAYAICCMQLTKCRDIHSNGIANKFAHISKFNIVCPYNVIIGEHIAHHDQWLCNSLERCLYPVS